MSVWATALYTFSSSKLGENFSLFLNNFYEYDIFLKSLFTFAKQNESALLHIFKIKMG